MCGGQIEPDDVALRDELVVCPFCSTVNRITPTGTEKSAESFQKREKPMGVKIEKNGEGDYLFYVGGYGYSYEGVYLPLVVIRILISIPAIAFILYLIGAFINPRQFLNVESLFQILFALVFCSISLLFFVGFIASTVSERFSYPPPIKLTRDTLYGSEYSNFWGRKPSVPIKDIRQIYTVFHQLQRIPSDSFLFRGVTKNLSLSQINILKTYRASSYSIYVLTHTGKRIPIMPKISEQYAEAALYIEETIEIMTGLFDLPVYGDQNLPRNLETELNVASTHKSTPEALNCKCCGAPLPIPASPLKGYLVCEYCHVLSLLFGAGNNKPVLGLPKLNSPASQFEITKTGNRLRIRSRHMNQTEELLLSKTELGFNGPYSKKILPLDRAEIATIFVKEKELPGPTSGVSFSFDDKWADELAHSGDLEKSYKRVQGTLFYQIIAKTTSGKEICLLDQIKNPYEALAFVGQMCQLYNLIPMKVTV